MSKSRTYTHYELLQIVPVSGYQAVYCDDGLHHATPVYMLSLARVTERDLYTDEVRGDGCSDVVAIEPDGRAWSVCAEAGNYVTTLAPHQSLADFGPEACTHCYIRRNAQQEMRR